MTNKRCLGLMAAGLVPLVWAQLLAHQVPNQTPTGWATVRGRVLDSGGRPVTGAKISAFPMDAAVSGGMPRQPVTDQEGRYRLTLPAYPGRTRLCAVKESAGYPDTQGLLFASETDSMPEVSLPADGYLENIDIHLGPPDGVLEGSVVDAITGSPISNARITLHRDTPESMYSTSLPADGHFLLALPPAPIEASVEAPGYRSWRYKDPKTQSNGLVLQSSEDRRITIGLTPR
jgi:hypothetical protein